MKRRIHIFMAVVCAAALVPRALEAGTGIKVGYSLAKIHQTSSGPLPFGWGDLRSLVLGFSFEGGLGPISLQPEFLYVRMGGRHSIDAANGLEYRFHYLQVPVMLKFDVIPFGPLRPFVAGGVYGSYLIKAQGVLTVAGETTKVGFTGDHERLDYGAVGGAGLALKLPGISLSVEGRYNYGLMNIIKNPAAGESMKNRCLMVLFGIRY
ncbi:MAG: porin family protein [Candidatus Aminicenantes bacterium RBG_16_66_30]